MTVRVDRVGEDALLAKGWWQSHRWLVLRRAVQSFILLLFLAGPWFGLWIAKGNLNYNLTFNTLPLTDPLVLLQSLVSGHVPLRNALIGAAIVLIFYMVVGGRTYCAWVCPVNVVTDAASAVRRRLGIRGGGDFSASTRYWLLAAVLLLAAGSGHIVWDLVNPVSVLHRGLVFGMGAGWLLIGSIFLLDVFVMERAWCGHLCPVGGFYSLLGRWRRVHVTAVQREACNNCLDCFAICPEPQVIRLPLKGAGKGVGPVITDINCSNCGRCIDICSKDVFAFGLGRLSSVAASHNTALTPQ